MIVNPVFIFKNGLTIFEILNYNINIFQFFFFAKHEVHDKKNNFYGDRQGLYGHEINGQMISALKEKIQLNTIDLKKNVLFEIQTYCNLFTFYPTLN